MVLILAISESVIMTIFSGLQNNVNHSAPLVSTYLACNHILLLELT